MKRSAFLTAIALLTLATFSFSGCSSSPGGAAANVIKFNANIQPVCPNNVLCVDAGQPIVINAVLPGGGAIRVAQADAAHPEATGPGVTWAITSGPGSLVNPTATSVTFQAEPPPIAAPAMTTITATSTTNASLKGSITITTNPTPTVTTTSLNPATEFSAASGEQLNSSGGSGHKLWALAGGTTPPPGLTLNADGSVTGTPTGPKGNFNFQVTVTDGATPPLTSPVAMVSIMIAWPPAPAINPTSLPNAPQGSAYNQTITASQGHPPYTLAVSGTPPTSLGLTDTINNAAGTLSITGMPSAAVGTAANFTLTITDSSNPPQVVPFPLSVTVGQAAPLAFSGSTLSPATDGTAYPTQLVSASGGLQPYTYTITGGSLPHGMNGAQSGSSFQFSGTPNDVAQMYSLTVQVKDSSNPQQVKSATFNLTVNPAPALTLTPSNAALPAATVGNMYTQAIMAGGGIPPYSFTITNNTLPGTLTIMPGNGPGSGANSATETISGTPTAAETTDGVTIEVSDSSFPTAMTKAIAYTLDVNSVAAACVLAGKQVAYEMTGSDATGPGVELGSITIGPDGSLTGALDFRNQTTLSANQSISGPAGSCTNGALANTGTLAFNAGGTAHTLAFSIPTNFATGAIGHVVEKDFAGAGQMQIQESPTTSLEGSRAFGLEGFSSTVEAFAIGAVCLNAQSSISFLQADFSVNLMEINMVGGGANPGAFSAPDSNGRATTTSPVTYSNGTTLNNTVYVVNPHKAYIMVSNGTAPGLGNLPPQAGFLSGVPGTSCLPTGQGGSFTSSSLVPSTFFSHGVSGSAGALNGTGVISGAVLSVNAASGMLTYEDDESAAGTSGTTGVQNGTYSIPPGNNGRGTIGTVDNKGRAVTHEFYLDGNNNAYIILGDHNGEGIAFGVVRPRSATTIATGTYAFGTQLLVLGASVLGVTQVQITANTISDLAPGGSSGNYSCDMTGRCTAPTLNNNVTFGDTSISFYINGNMDSSTTMNEINVIQLTTTTPVGGGLEE